MLNIHDSNSDMSTGSVSSPSLSAGALPAFSLLKAAPCKHPASLLGEG